MTDDSVPDVDRIPWDWARVECPTCGAEPDTRCRALTTGRRTDCHTRRREMGSLHNYRKRLRQHAECNHPFRHTRYGSEDPRDNGTTGAICGANL